MNHSLSSYEVEIQGKVVSQWTSFEKAFEAATHHGIVKALKTGQIAGFKVFYRTAIMQHGVRKRHLVLEATAKPLPTESPAALETPRA